MVTSGGIENTSSNIHKASHLSSDHEELDTRMTLHARDATAVGYKINVGKCLDTDQGIRCVYTVTVSPQACSIDMFGCSREQRE